MGAAAQSRTLSWRSSTYTAIASHSSNLLIGLLLSIGIPVIGYFTLVRLELAECKGQATSLSGSCKPVVHQLSSAFTRMSKCSETLLAWISFAMSIIYPQTMLSSYLKSEEVAMEWVTCLLVGMCWDGRRRGGTLLIIWRIVASAGFCGHLLSYTRSLCQEIFKADKYSLFYKLWLQRRKGPAWKSSLERLGTPKPLVFETNCSTSAFMTERNTSGRKPGLKHSGRLESYKDRNTNHFSALTQQSERLHLQQSDLSSHVSCSTLFRIFPYQAFRYHYLKSKRHTTFLPVLFPIHYMSQF